MTVLDASLLLYAYDSGSLHHGKSRVWLQRLFSSGDPVGLPWQSVSAFCRVVTNQRLPGNRFTMQEAVEIVDSWVRQPNVRLLAPGEQHWTLLRRQLLEGQAIGPLVTDAQLAA
jgi:toxin-antitoxin system PIN domain toxin